jgi:hypothetical protein
MISEARITEQLRLRLDEVGLVYQQLPITLERARKATVGEAWHAFLHDQATALKSQWLILRATAASWGKRTRPFYSPEVDEQLNEALHAVRAKRIVPAMEERVRDVISVLRARVLARLEEAIELATSIREHDLVERLRHLYREESDLQLALEQSRSGG